MDSLDASSNFARKRSRIRSGGCNVIGMQRGRVQYIAFGHFEKPALIIADEVERDIEKNVKDGWFTNLAV